MNFTKGGVNNFNPHEDITSVEKGMYGNREGYYGWFGYGGSVMQWHPELKIGFAFVPTFLNTTEMFNQRGAILQKLVVVLQVQISLFFFNLCMQKINEQS